MDKGQVALHESFWIWARPLRGLTEPISIIIPGLWYLLYVGYQAKKHKREGQMAMWYYLISMHKYPDSEDHK